MTTQHLFSPNLKNILKNEQYLKEKVKIIIFKKLQPWNLLSIFTWKITYTWFIYKNPKNSNAVE